MDIRHQINVRQQTGRFKDVSLSIVFNDRPRCTKHQCLLEVRLCDLEPPRLEHMDATASKRYSSTAPSTPGIAACRLDC
jgi:hypothetical protein